MSHLDRANAVERAICKLTGEVYINDMADAVDSRGRFREIKSIMETVEGGTRRGRVRFKPGQLQWLKERGSVVSIVIETEDHRFLHYEIDAGRIPGEHVSVASIIKAGAVFTGCVIVEGF